MHRGTPSPSRGSSPFRGSRSSSLPAQRDRNQHHSSVPEKKKRLNPPDRTGAPKRCAICGSVMHFARDCPHNDEPPEQTEDDTIPTLLTVEVPPIETLRSDELYVDTGDGEIVLDEMRENDVESHDEHEYVPSLFANNIHHKYKDCFTGEALPVSYTHLTLPTKA